MKIGGLKVLKIFKVGLFALLLAIFTAFASSYVFAIDVDIYEPDNNFTIANAIPTNGTLQHHSFHVGGDEDWIKFNVTNEEFFIIETTNLLDGADTFIFLYDSDGTTLIDSNDDISEGNLASKIVYQTDANETNYVKIRHFSSSGTGNYSISVNEIIFEKDQYEPDDNFTQATEILANGTLQTHNIFPAGDEDWVKFNATANRVYEIKSFNFQNNANIVLEVYNTDGITLLVKDFSFEPIVIFVPGVNGTYFVKFLDIEDDAIGGIYDVSITLNALLIPSLVSPSQDIIVQKNSTFDFESSVTCLEGDCGNVTAALHLANDNSNLFSLNIDLNQDTLDNTYTSFSSIEDYDNEIKYALSNEEKIEVGIENLEIDDIDIYDNDVYVKYGQKYESLPVYGGIVKLLVRDNKIIGANNRFFEGIDIETKPTVSKEEAESIASGNNLEISDAELVVYPKNGQFFLAWKVDVFDSKDPSIALRVFVDANTGEIIDIVDMIIYNTASGTVTGMIFPEHLAQQQVNMPFSNQFINFFDSNTNNVLNLTTNKSGKYSTNQLIGNIAGNALLQGPFVMVLNEDKPEANHSFNGTIPFVHDWNWNESDTSDGQEDSNMFYHVNVVHDYFTKGVPFNISAMNYQIVATVEVDDDFCNAFYDSISKNIFFGNSSACGNLALMSDVIYHEYTHAVVDHVYTPGLLMDDEGGAMHEGYADYFATTINNNSCLSEGFSGLNCLRDVNNSIKYEDVQNSEIHTFGLTFGGSLWDLRENLSRDSADSLTIRAMKLEPVTMSEFLDSLLIVDDNNADLVDGTPNQDAICEAFSTNHHISSVNCGDGGVVPKNSGGFFYTVNPNPVNDACLSNMTENEVCLTKWTVNVTNAPKGRWKFFAVYSNNLQSARTGNATILIEGPPDLNPININEIAQEDSLFSFNVSTISGSNPPHTFSTSNNTKYAVTKISDTKAKIRFTPTNNDVPSVTLIVFVTDNHGLTDSEQVTIQVNNTNDVPIIVSAHTPYSNPKIHSSKNITFNVTASDPDEKHGDAIAISWYVNNTINTTGKFFTFSPSKIGDYSILANLTDKENASATREWALTVAEKPIANTFDPSETTDFSNITNLSNVKDVTLGKEKGKISFKESLDLRFVVDLDNLINISEGLIQIDTSQLSELNKSATLVMKNLQFARKPKILVDDGSGFKECPSALCTNINYENNMLTFDVAHFSAYKAVEDVLSIEESKLGIKNIKVRVDDDLDNVREGGDVNDIKPGSKLRITVEVENLFEEEEDIEIGDIGLEVTILDIDDGGDLDKDADLDDLEPGDDDFASLTFDIPLNVEERKHRVEVEVKGVDNSVDRNVHETSENFFLDIEKENHELIINKYKLISQVSCNARTGLDLELINTGSNDEDEVILTVESPDISLNFRQELELVEGEGEDDDGSIYSESIPITVSNQIVSGNYPVYIKSYYDSTKLSDEKTLDLIVRECEVKKSEAIVLKAASKEDPKVEVLYAQTRQTASVVSTKEIGPRSFFDEEFILAILISLHIAFIGLIIFLAGYYSLAGKKK